MEIVNSGLANGKPNFPRIFSGRILKYHLNNTGELATNRDILISEHGDIETFTPTY